MCWQEIYRKNLKNGEGLDTTESSLANKVFTSLGSTLSGKTKISSCFHRFLRWIEYGWAYNVYTDLYMRGVIKRDEYLKRVKTIELRRKEG